MSRAAEKQLSLVSWLDLTAKEKEITQELVREMAGIPEFLVRLLEFILSETEVSQEDS